MILVPTNVIQESKMFISRCRQIITKLFCSKSKNNNLVDKWYCHHGAKPFLEIISQLLIKKLVRYFKKR